MRIEAYNQVAQIYKTHKSAGTDRAAKTAAGYDELQISSFGRDYQVAKQAVADAPDVREDRVAAVAAKMNSNRYQVSTEDFACRLIEKYQSIM